MAPLTMFLPFGLLWNLKMFYNSSNVDARKVFGFVCFYFDLWTMFPDLSISTLRSYCYLKDLKQVSYVCCNLAYGKEDQTLLIDDEPCKVF